MYEELIDRIVDKVWDDVSRSGFITLSALTDTYIELLDAIETTIDEKIVDRYVKYVKGKNPDTMVI